jgi:hypothetical protein
VSRTLRVRQPLTDSPYQCSGSGASEIRPRCGLSPKSPQLAAGIRIEPAPSEAVAAPIRPAATAAPLPPLEPPGVRSRSHGLRVAPQVFDSVKPKIASSGRFVFPIGTAPAARRRLTSSEWSAAARSNPPVPNAVTSPSTSLTSLIATGTPSSGASSPSARRRSALSASDSALSPHTTRNALSRGSR